MIDEGYVAVHPVRTILPNLDLDVCHFEPEVWGDRGIADAGRYCVNTTYILTVLRSRSWLHWSANPFCRTTVATCPQWRMP